MEVSLIVVTLATFAAAQVMAEQCRDAKGKFVKCETTKKKVQCKHAEGEFAKCGTTGATPVN